MNYTIGINGAGLAQQLNITSYPTIYIVDKQGKVFTTIVGEYGSLEEDLIKIINQMLNE